MRHTGGDIRFVVNQDRIITAETLPKLMYYAELSRKRD